MGELPPLFERGGRAEDAGRLGCLVVCRETELEALLNLARKLRRRLLDVASAGVGDAMHAL